MGEIDLAWLEPKSPKEIMDEAIAKYDLDALYVLYSGGKDSVCVNDFIAKKYPKLFKGNVFSVTGFGSSVTRKFAIDYSNKRGWKLNLTWPRPDETYYKYVLTHGFPGPGTHRNIMAWIKFRTWTRFIRDKLNKGEKAAFISGVRKKESKARNKNRQYTRVPVDITDNRIIFIKPFLYKNGTQLWEYYNENELEKSKTYTWFDKSGECYCGAYAEEWELKMLEKYDKFAFETIKWLEKEIQLKGTTKAKQYGTWGHGPTTFDIESQMSMEDYCGESCVVS